eukprot:COSAG03_NODE_1499_length_3976_cov_3.497034_2_plen_228_part_00
MPPPPASPPPGWRPVDNKRRGAAVPRPAKRAKGRGEPVRAAFKSGAAGLTRPLIVALLRKEYKSSRKKQFDELGITAATPRETLLGFLADTNLARADPEQFAPKGTGQGWQTANEVPRHMLAAEPQEQCVADRLRDTFGSDTVRFMWTGEGWQMQPLKEVEAAVRQARELELERCRALVAREVTRDFGSRHKDGKTAISENHFSCTYGYILIPSCNMGELFRCCLIV